MHGIETTLVSHWCNENTSCVCCPISTNPLLIYVIPIVLVLDDFFQTVGILASNRNGTNSTDSNGISPAVDILIHNLIGPRSPNPEPSSLNKALREHRTKEMAPDLCYKQSDQLLTLNVAISQISRETWLKISWE